MMLFTLVVFSLDRYWEMAFSIPMSGQWRRVNNRRSRHEEGRIRVSVNLSNIEFGPVSSLSNEFSLNVLCNKNCKLFINFPLLKDLKNKRAVQPFIFLNY